MTKSKRPSTRELKVILKGMLSGTLEHRIETLKKALLWYDKVQNYVTSSKRFKIGKAELGFISKATKCRALGISEKSKEAKETAFLQAVNMMEKFAEVSGFGKLPKAKDAYKNFQANKDALEEAEAKLQLRYSRLIDSLTAMTGGEISFQVSKAATKARAIDITEKNTLTYSRKQANVLFRKMRSEGVLDLFASEIPYLGRVLALKSNEQGGFFVDAKEQAEAQIRLLAAFALYARSEAAPKRLVRFRKQVQGGVAQPRKQASVAGRKFGSGPKVGGRYKQGSAIGKIWELLSDQKEHDLDEVRALNLGTSDPMGRLKRLTIHGVEESRWDVTINGSKVRMEIRS